MNKNGDVPLGETDIRALLNEFASTERTDDFFLEHGTQDFLFIRPSGNPLDAEEFSDMFKSGDITIHDAEFVALERLNFHGNVAIAVFIMKGSFTYQGRANSDTYAATALLRNVDGEWKFALFQRSSGATDLSSWQAFSSKNLTLEKEGLRLSP